MVIREKQTPERDPEQERPLCENCMLCIRTYLGCECSLTDNIVEGLQPACIDYIPED